ncbi:MAG: sulfatase-like hydrolase/transferase [Candidatus Lokiarchaeota archaeon]|nr:sulfatase-like hydrolase/transferase [Candidatus Lokiarchaeota archaeon]MBD3201750.1 sulfatase-like hydrolase/transferase [Candidatus Lokiarchaeota archaeon]
MSKKMNVLFIISDAHRADHLSCYGNTQLKTPNIDRLASEGIRFTNYFCTNPICMPNRATLLTGKYPNVHGVRSNGMKLNEELPTFTNTLKKRGWHTAAIGKIHHQYWMAPFKRKYTSAENLITWAYPDSGNDPVKENFPIPYYGYDEVELIVGNGSICSGHYLEWLEEKSKTIANKVKERIPNYDNLFSLFCDPIPKEFYSSTYVKERTNAFLERYSSGQYGDKPFYLQCSFPDPHYPVAPPEEFRKIYPPDKIQLPSSFDDIENLYEHEYLGEHLKKPPFKKAFLREANEDETRKFIALTYASVAYMDHCIGEILANLESLELSENTIVIYTSDHGDLMGDHGLLFKGPCPFNGVLQLPFIWKVPGITTPGSISDSLISSIDYPETILNLLGIKKRHQPPDMQGYDFQKILKNPEAEIRDVCYVENDEEIGTLKSRLRHLITKNYKLTIYQNNPLFGDLYDRKNDPEELNNLWEDANYKEIRFELIDKLLHESLNALGETPKRIAGT